MSMNLHHLLVFHTIAKTGSITAAAKVLHITQPALSRELHVLEQRFGLPLFERCPRGMRLTHAGDVLQEYASRLFEISQAADFAMKELADARMGHLSIAASNTIGTYILPALLTRFRNQHPNVTVTLFIGNTAQVSEAVADMRYSMGFIEGPLHVLGIIATTFRQDMLVPVAAPSHRLANTMQVSSKSLEQQVLLMREVGSGTRELIEGMLVRLNVRTGPIMQFGSTEAVKQAAIHDGGIAWLSAQSISEELENQSLVILQGEDLTIHRDLRVIQRLGGGESPVNSAFIKLLLQC